MEHDGETTKCPVNVLPGKVEENLNLKTTVVDVREDVTSFIPKLFLFLHQSSTKIKLAQYIYLDFIIITILVFNLVPTLYLMYYIIFLYNVEYSYCIS